MKRTHLAVQAAIVLTMVASVSWPQFQPVRAQSVWRYVPAAILQAKTTDAARFTGDARPAGVRAGAGLDNASFRSPMDTTAQNTLTDQQNDPSYSIPAEDAVHS